jgi:hypothetical protein
VSGECVARPRRTPVADLFEESFHQYRTNFLLLLLISAIVQIPSTLVFLPLMEQPMVATLEELVPLFAGSAVLILGVTILGTFGGAAMSYVVGRGHRGEHPPVVDVLRAVWRLTPALLGFLFVLGGLLLAVLLAFGLSIALAAFVGGATGDEEVAFLLLAVAVIGAALVYGVVVARFLLVLPVLVLERRSPIAALRRSADLVRGATWRTLGIFFLATLVIGVITTVVNPLFLPGAMEGYLTGSSAIPIVVTALSGVVNAVVTPILPALITVMYFDYARGPLAPAP